MTTYLLTWNPANWDWDRTDLKESIKQIKTQGYCFESWSCGVTKKIVPEDRVFLMKLGKEEPRGIAASGWVVSEVYEGAHWNEVARREGRTALYIDVHFDTILDPHKGVFPRALLNGGIYTKMHWEPEASGVTIPSDVAAQLEKDWAQHLKRPVPFSGTVFPEEVEAAKTFVEGRTRQITVNSYERSAEARSICIRHYGLDCSVCGFNFQAMYGEIGGSFIHVHHLKALSKVGTDYTLDPIKDLRPVCPNCHAMLHQRKPDAYSIKELKAIINKAKGNSGIV
jgi:5-methylcytosine-specific restriction protein A